MDCSLSCSVTYHGDNHVSPFHLDADNGFLVLYINMSIRCGLSVELYDTMLQLLAIDYIEDEEWVGGPMIL